MAEFEAKIVKLCSGWETQVPKEVEAFYLDGRKYDVKETGETLEVIAGHLKDVATTRTAYRAAVAFRDRNLAEWHALVAAVGTQLLQRMGHTSAALRQLGVTPPKERAQPTVEDQAIAVELRRRTRKARGTLGKKQRLAIKAEPQPTLRILGPDGQPLGPASEDPATSASAPPRKKAPRQKAPRKLAARSSRRGK